MSAQKQKKHHHCRVCQYIDKGDNEQLFALYSENQCKQQLKNEGQHKRRCKRRENIIISHFSAPFLCRKAAGA